MNPNDENDHDQPDHEISAHDRAYDEWERNAEHGHEHEHEHEYDPDDDHPGSGGDPHDLVDPERETEIEDPSDDQAAVVLPEHPLAGIFPMMTEEDLAALAEDIRIHGQRAPITVLDGQILDGRNRYQACLRLGIEPRFRQFREEDPMEFVLSVNLHRRHLSESQRAMVAGKIANMPLGDASRSAALSGRSANLRTASNSFVSIDKAAAQLNVSSRSVQTAKKVLKDPEQTRAVVAGEKTVSAAAKEMKDKAAKLAAGAIPRDATGYAIPADLVPLWNRAGEVLDLQKAIGQVKRRVIAVRADREDRLWSGAAMQTITDLLHRAQRDLDGAVPYAVCATCQGHSRDQCLHCKGKGFLSKHLFDRTVPDDLKAIRAKSCVLPGHPQPAATR